MDAAIDDLPMAQQRSIWPQLIAPRPIALVSSLSADGRHNIAPYNSFSGLATSPPMIGLSIGSRRSGEKRTLDCIRQHNAFVINLVPRFLADIMIQAAEDVAEPGDDFERLGLKPMPTRHVPGSRIQECPAALECRVTQIVAMPPSRATLVIAQVVGVSIRDEFYDSEKGFDALAADLLASIGIDQYVSVNGETLTLPVSWE